MFTSGIRKITVQNWKNIPLIEIEDLGDFSVLVGPNASGKSNFLDVILFLRDISRHGLQYAVNTRGGMEKIRSLSAKRVTDISIELDIDINGTRWKYVLIINKKPKQKELSEDESSRAYIKEEAVYRNNSEIATRVPEKNDSDLVTYLETPFKNESFKELVEYFGKVEILHIVPQMVKERQVKDTDKKELDIYGRNFIERIGRTSMKVREKYLNQISSSMKGAIGHFESLMLEQDKNSGVFHLVARFKNWRDSSAKHNEFFLSDGTIRLIGILWTLLEKKDGILLIDEPEVSLHTAIIRALPRIIAEIQLKSNIQVIVTTHSYEFISKDAGIESNNIFIVAPDEKGESSVIGLDKRNDAKELLASGFTFQETLTSITSSQTHLDL